MDTERVTCGAAHESGCEADPGMDLIGPYPAMSARSNGLTGGGERLQSGLDGWMDGGETYIIARAGLFPSAHPSRTQSAIQQPPSSRIIIARAPAPPPPQRLESASAAMAAVAATMGALLALVP
jgi:hypothetical protein